MSPPEVRGAVPNGISPPDLDLPVSIDCAVGLGIRIYGNSPVPRQHRGHYL